MKSSNAYLVLGVMLAYSALIGAHFADPLASPEFIWNSPPAGGVRGEPGPDNPNCIQPCQYDTYIDKKSTTQDASCPVKEPHRMEWYHCDRYECTNGHYYVKIHDSWGSCQAQSEGAGCPSNSCNPPPG